MQFFVPQTINDGFFKNASMTGNFNAAGSHFTGHVYAATKMSEYYGWSGLS